MMFNNIKFPIKLFIIIFFPLLLAFYLSFTNIYNQFSEQEDLNSANQLTDITNIFGNLFFNIASEATLSVYRMQSEDIGDDGQSLRVYQKNVDDNLDQFKEKRVQFLTAETPILNKIISQTSSI